MICFVINFQLIPRTGLPSLCSGFQIDNNLIYKRITSRWSVILLGGENDKKGEVGSFMPKTNGIKILRILPCLINSLSTSNQDLSLIFFIIQGSLRENALYGIKKGALSPFFVILRRVRDSNPRTFYSQQFSRLPQSTALPTLRGKCRKGNRNLQKYLQFIWLNNWSNLLTTMYLYKNGLSERIICIKCVFLEI